MTAAECWRCWRRLARAAGYRGIAIVESWVGFRPGSRDDARSSTDRNRRACAGTGHHRNGILLAPITADAIASYIVTGTIDEAIKPWADRFIESVETGTMEHPLNVRAAPGGGVDIAELWTSSVSIRRCRGSPSRSIGR